MLAQRAPLRQSIYSFKDPIPNLSFFPVHIDKRRLLAAVELTFPKIRKDRQKQHATVVVLRELVLL